MKVLLITDSPSLPTGMGVVHKNIGLQLTSRGYNVVSIGWNPTGVIENRMPWKEYIPDKRFYYGESIFDSVIEAETPDVVVTIGDPWTIDYVRHSRVRYGFKWIGYTAIDGHTYSGGIPPSWVATFKDMDKLITYTQYGKDIITKSIPEDSNKISIIPHGVDLKTFYPMANMTALRKKFSIPEDYVIFLLVARNQFRKNIPEIFKAWAKFRTKDIKAFLFPHMVFRDARGWDLNEIIDICGIGDSIVFIKDYAHASSHLNCVDNNVLNEIYNVSDVLVLMSGEGFGLPLVEAMACKKPIITLDHSACKELVGGRGELVPVSYSITGVHATERPLFTQENLVSSFKKMYDDILLRKVYGESGYQFVQKLSWDRIGDMWDTELKKIENPFFGKCELERVC